MSAVNTPVRLDRSDTAAMITRAADGFIERDAEGKLTVPAWVWLLAKITATHSSHQDTGPRPTWRTKNRVDVFRSAVERCRRDLASAEFMLAMFAVVADDEEVKRSGQAYADVVTFAERRPQTIRCACGEVFNWPDLYLEHTKALQSPRTPQQGVSRVFRLSGAAASRRACPGRPGRLLCRQCCTLQCSLLHPPFRLQPFLLAHKVTKHVADKVRDCDIERLGKRVDAVFFRWGNSALHLYSSGFFLRVS